MKDSAPYTNHNNPKLDGEEEQSKMKMKPSYNNRIIATCSTCKIKLKLGDGWENIGKGILCFKCLHEATKSLVDKFYYG